MNAWFDASNGLTLSGNNVTGWTDLSGNGHHAAVGNGTPTVDLTSINGLAAVQFRGSTLSVGGTLFAKEQYYVFRSAPGNTAWNNYGSVFGKDNDDRNSSYLLQSGGTGFHGNPFPLAVSRNGTVITNNGGDANLAPIDQYMLLKIDVNDSNTGVTAYSLGGQGQWRNNLDVAEVITYDHTLNASEENNVGAYLAGKYGITTSYTGGNSVGTSGNLDMSSTNLTVTANSTLNPFTDGSTSFGTLALNGGVVTAKGSPSGISFNGTTVAAAATSGVNAKVTVALGALTIGNAGTFTGAGTITNTGVTLSGASGGIRTSGTMTVANYNDGAAAKTLSLGGTGTAGGTGTVFVNNTAGGFVAGSTRLRITGSTVDTTVTTAHSPLGGSTAIEMAGGKLKLTGSVTTVAGGLDAGLHYLNYDRNTYLRYENGGSLLSLTPSETRFDTGLGNSNGVGINYNGTFNTLFPGIQRTERFFVSWSGTLTAPSTGSYNLNSFWSDDSYVTYVDLNQNGTFEATERRWEVGANGGAQGAFNLTAGQTYKVALGFGENEGGENVGFKIEGPNGLNENVNPSSVNQTGMWSSQNIGAINYAGTTVRVDADSEIAGATDSGMTFGALTLNSGVLTLSAPLTTFASTILTPGATLVGINNSATVVFGGINGNGATATFAKQGTGTLVLNETNSNLENVTFDAQAGTLAFLTTNSLGASTNARVSGGTLLLSGTANTTYDVNLSATQNSTLRAAKATGGADNLTMTLGTPGKTLTVAASRTLTVNTANGYTLNINEGITMLDNSILTTENGSTVNINNNGAASLSMGNGATINLNGGATLSTDKDMSVWNLNATGGNLVMNGHNLNVNGQLIVDNGSTNLNFTGGAQLATAGNATVDMRQGTLTVDSPLTLGNLTVRNNATLNRAPGAAGNVTVSGEFRLANNSHNFTGSTLSVGNQMFLTGNTVLTTTTPFTANNVQLQDSARWNAAGITVSGDFNIYGGNASVSVGGNWSVGSQLRMFDDGRKELNFTTAGRTLTVGSRIDIRSGNRLTTGANAMTFNELYVEGYAYGHQALFKAGANMTINGQIEVFNGALADFTGHTLTTNFQNMNIGEVGGPDSVMGRTRAELRTDSALSINLTNVRDGGVLNAPRILLNDRFDLTRGGIINANITFNNLGNSATINGGGGDDIFRDRTGYLNGNNTWTGRTNIQDNSILAADYGVGVPSGSDVSFRGGGGVFGTQGSFSRVIGDQAGQVYLNPEGRGGFAGYGGALTVSLGTANLAPTSPASARRLAAPFGCGPIRPMATVPAPRCKRTAR